MHILAIETTSLYGSCALIDGEGGIIGYEVSEGHMSHLKDLIPMIQRMLNKLGLTGNDISAIACDVGPGSFTGIRIGVSAARALAQIWDVPCVPVSSLTSVLYKDGQLGSGESDTVAVMIHNARRRQVYGFIDGYLNEGPWLIDDITETADKRIPRDKKLRFYGDGTDAYGDIIREELDKAGVSYEFAPVGERYPAASEIARCGLIKYREGQTKPFDELLPDYMREAEAEQKLRAGELPISRLPEQE